METLRLSNPARNEEPEKWGTRFILLSLLLNPDEGSQLVGTAGTSGSDLFFSEAYEASADAKFGLKPQGSDYS